MSIQQLVPSKEVCEQLAAAGFPQETCFYWYIVDDKYNVPPRVVNYYSEPKSGHYSSTDDNYTERWIAAPTAQEIAAELRKHSSMIQNVYMNHTQERIRQLMIRIYRSWENPDMTNDFAKLYLYLKSNNLL